MAVEFDAATKHGYRRHVRFSQWLLLCVTQVLIVFVSFSLLLSFLYVLPFGFVPALCCSVTGVKYKPYHRAMLYVSRFDRMCFLPVFFLLLVFVSPPPS